MGDTSGARQSRPNAEAIVAAGPPRRIGRRWAATFAGAVVVAVLASACIVNGLWASTPAPVTPVQSVATRFNDVSCVSEDWCLGVGSLGAFPLAEVWDGTSWSVVTAPPLGGETNTAVNAVDCASPTSCVVTVTRVVPSPDIYDFALGWDGEGWHELSEAAEGFIDNFPSSCAPGGRCVVVDKAGQATVVWDGESATVIPFATSYPPGEIAALDCLTDALCVATTDENLTIWNGSTWSGFLPGGEFWEIITWDGPSTLACVAGDDCLYAGRKASGPGWTSAQWDGSSWTEAALPAGVTAIGDLSCAGPGACLLPVTVGGSDAALAWNGTSWFQAPTPPAGVSAVSCLPLRCLGVGGTGSPSVPVAATYDWTNP